MRGVSPDTIASPGRCVSRIARASTSPGATRPKTLQGALETHLVHRWGTCRSFEYWDLAAVPRVSLEGYNRPAPRSSSFRLRRLWENVLPRTSYGHPETLPSPEPARLGFYGNISPRNGMREGPRMLRGGAGSRPLLTQRTRRHTLWLFKPRSRHATST